MAKAGAQEKERGKEPETEKEVPAVPIRAVKMIPSVLSGIEVVPVPRDAWGKIPKEGGRREEFEFTHEKFGASRDGATATTGFLFPANVDGRQIYGMEYRMKDETMRFTYFTRGEEPGEVRAVIPGEEHTVVVTTTQAILVAGWAAWQRGEHEIVVDGQPQRGTNAIYFGLSEQFRGDSLISVGASYAGGMTTIFTMNRDGLLGARGVSLSSILYADRQFEPSEGWQLLSAGDVVLLVKEGSANAYVLSADLSGVPRKIGVHTIVLPEAIRGRAELIRGEGGYAIMHDGTEIGVMDSELHPSAQ